MGRGAPCATADSKQSKTVLASVGREHLPTRWMLSRQTTRMLRLIAAVFFLICLVITNISSSQIMMPESELRAVESTVLPSAPAVPPMETAVLPSLAPFVSFVSGPTPIQDGEAFAMRFMHQLEHIYGNRESNPVPINYTMMTSARDFTPDALAASALTAYSNFSYISGPQDAMWFPMTCETYASLPAKRSVVVRSVLAQFFEKPSVVDVSSVERKPSVANASLAWEEGREGIDEAHRGALYSSSRARQCLSVSAFMPVLAIDRGAFTRIVHTQSTNGEGKPLAQQPFLVDREAVLYEPNVVAGVQVDPDVSRKLERTYGFDNTHLYTKKEGDENVAFPKVVKVEGGAWASTTFYAGPASDALLPNNPNASVREAWARRKVDWVPTRNPHETDSYDYWWDYDDEAEDGNMPCTQYIQHRFHALMNPYSCDTMPKLKDWDSHDPFGVLEEEERRGLSNHTRYFVSNFRDKSMNHGVGASFYLAAHDFLTAVTLKRVVVYKLFGGRLSKYRGGAKWSQASDVCAEAGRPSIDCHFQYASHCQYKATRKTLFGAARMVTKDDALTTFFDTDSVERDVFQSQGLSRTHVPSDEEFFGRAFVKGRRRDNSIRIPKCYQRYLKWTGQDKSHYYATDAAANSSNPRLNYMESQAVRYTIRYQQPWFYNMLSQGLGRVGMGRGVPTWKGPGHAQPEQDKAQAVRTSANDNQLMLSPHTHFASLTLHERGEIEKYREHHSVIGCHTVKMEMMVDLVSAYCGYGFPTAPSTQFESESNVSFTSLISQSDFPKQGLSNTPHLYHPPCHVFISGNTPSQGFALVKRAFAKRTHQNGSRPIVVTSTWDLSSSRAKLAEASNYGAKSPSAGWIDLYAGASATHWNCIGHSNWCRMFNYLRETSGRAVCGGFVDTGTMMLSSARLREAYCFVNTSWPRKKFGRCAYATAEIAMMLKPNATKKSRK